MFAYWLTCGYFNIFQTIVNKKMTQKELFFGHPEHRRRVYPPKILAPYPLLGSMIGFSRVFRSTKPVIPFLKTLNNCNENNIK